MKNKILMLVIINSLMIAFNVFAVSQNTGQTTHRPVSPEGEILPLYNECYGKKDKECEQSIIKKGDVISIKLLRSFICDFNESTPKEKFKRFFTRDKERRKTDKHGSKKDSKEETCWNNRYSDLETQGEIAILVNVVELGHGEPLAQGPDAVNNARVVYFDSDVRETGEILDFSKLVPIYGPIKYNGGILSVQLYIVEIDNVENERVKALLTNLAKWGGKLYPPGEPTLDLVSGLGASLIGDDDSNDLELSYQFTFDAFGTKTHSSAPLTHGNFVVLKDHNYNPDKLFDWKSVTYDPKTGLLNDKDLKVYRKHTYLTFSVETGGMPIKPLKRETLKELEKQFKTKSMKDIDSAIDKFSHEIARSSIKEELSNQMYQIYEESNIAEVAQKREEFWVNICRSLNDVTWKSKLNNDDINELLVQASSIPQWDHSSSDLFTQVKIKKDGVCNSKSPWYNQDKLPPLKSQTAEVPKKTST